MLSQLADLSLSAENAAMFQIRLRLALEKRPNDFFRDSHRRLFYHSHWRQRCLASGAFGSEPLPVDHPDRKFRPLSLNELQARWRDPSEPAGLIHSFRLRQSHPAQLIGVARVGVQPVPELPEETIGAANLDKSGLTVKFCKFAVPLIQPFCCG
jgi:hypothetical protein